MAGKITGNEPTLAMPDAAATPSVPPAPSQPASSTPERHVVAGRYEILGFVGAGGMGTVYRARDVELDEVVALKLLRRDVVDQPGMLDRFRQEVKLARRVTHRNVARTFDIGEHEGEKFLTMEFVEGESLASTIAREGALPLERVVSIASAICAGLGAAHEAGIVHRDLKPDNVLLSSDGSRVAITDFGIARALSDPGRAATMGIALGTPSYMAPEQVEGVRDLDGRADIYALGAMLYECLAGEPPWRGDSVWAIAAARLMQPPPDPRDKRPDLPQQAANLVMKCMARKRDDRFATAAQVAGALAALTMPVGDRGARTSAPPQVVAEMDEAKAVCVLPFRNLGRPDDDYLAEGLSDDLVDSLSMTPGLRVLARGAVARYRGVDRDARDVGRELRVQIVVEGSLRRHGGTLRVGTRVIGVADGFQLWAKRFDRPEQDLLSVSDEAAGAIAEVLTVKRAAHARVAPSDPRAVDLYLRARHAYHRGWRDHVTQAVALCEQALAIAPDDPAILCVYARAQLRRFMMNTETRDAAESENKARAAAERALQLAPHLGEARAALAHLSWALGDHGGCARDLREAMRLAPGSPDVNELCGRLLVEVGDLRKGIACLETAIALEPAMDIAQGDVMRARCLLGDWSMFDRVVEDRTFDDSQSNARFFLLARLSMWRGDTKITAPIRTALQGREFDFKSRVLSILDLVESRTLPPGATDEIMSWGRVASRSKRRPAFFQQLLAEFTSYVGDDAAALRAVEAADGHGLIDAAWVEHCPLLERLRESPAFAPVRGRILARARATLYALEGR